MRKELTWIAFAILASFFVVFILLGNNTLDLRIQDETVIFPSWTWAIPVFFFLSFIILFIQIRRDQFKGRKRPWIFLALGTAMLFILHFLRAYFVKLDDYLDKGKLLGFPVGTRDLWYSRNTLSVLTFLQVGMLACMIYVIYFCWIRTRRSHVNHYQN
jgi:hypothetical protein